jgi:amino acid transporter
MGGAGGALISAGAMISIAGNLNVLVLSGSRLPFAFAEKKQLPSILARVHPRFLTPHVSILINGALMMIVTLKSSFVAALTISAIARLVTYAVTCAALPVLRRKSSAPRALFRLPGGSIIAIAALILSAWLLLNSTRYEAIVSIIAAAVGFAIFLVYRLYRGRAS